MSSMEHFHSIEIQLVKATIGGAAEGMLQKKLFIIKAYRAYLLNSQSYFANDMPHKTEESVSRNVVEKRVCPIITPKILASPQFGQKGR